MSKIKVFYNSACPVCKAGIEGQRRRMQAGASCPVEWIDVHQRPDSVAELDSDLEQVRERLYLKDESGHIAIGVDAFAELFQHTRGQRWLGRLLRLPGLQPLARWGYNLFARGLYRWNRWLKHW
ncbi:thiol-disulfide oxidoreductase DCC family protein [Pseudomonas sp. MBLB4123]|uniref:thiol-disulfide oxidoreductase DCC family protein n=1 Tax=Pseudomonas sp. MBLB4123 TaxID=3451557 RepID=UPI003F74FB95